MSDRQIQSMLRLDSVSLQATVGSDFLLQDISFEIEPGEKVGIIGASGSGKTSLLRTLNGLVSTTEGIIYLRDLPIEQLKPTDLRRSIVLAPQEPKLLGMNVIESLSYPLRLQQRSPREIDSAIETWTRLLHIPTEWFLKTELQLSLGQRQLVAIARALIMQPQVILLDEPTSALDIGLASRLLKVLDELNQSQNLSIIIVNHQLELIEGFCDRLLFLNQGRLEYDLQATKANWQRLREKLSQLPIIEADWLDL
jgi:D-methionine transport system ATP-binding protein